MNSGPIIPLSRCHVRIHVFYVNTNVILPCVTSNLELIAQRKRANTRHHSWIRESGPTGILGNAGLRTDKRKCAIATQDSGLKVLNYPTSQFLSPQQCRATTPLLPSLAGTVRDLTLPTSIIWPAMVSPFQICNWILNHTRCMSFAHTRSFRLI